MNAAPSLPLLEPPPRAPARPVRDNCCLRYKRRGTKCPGCPLRPENAAATAVPAQGPPTIG
jgi:hypothetical protein